MYVLIQLYINRHVNAFKHLLSFVLIPTHSAVLPRLHRQLLTKPPNRTHHQRLTQLPHFNHPLPLRQHQQRIRTA